MKVVDQRGTATRFDDIDVGDFFYEADCRDPQCLYLKVPAGKDDSDCPCNSVCMKSGLFHCFTAETRVQVVEVEIFVVSNTAERPA